MNNNIKHLFYVCSLSALSLFASCTSNRELAAESEEVAQKQQEFYNLVNIKNVPKTEHDRNCFVFADLGSWIGYALPENEANQHSGGFVGPYMMTGRGWIASSIAKPTLLVNGEYFDFSRNILTAKYLPGKLIQEFRNEQILYVTELCFHSNHTAVIRTTIRNLSKQELNLSMTFDGELIGQKSSLHTINQGVEIETGVEEARLAIRFLTAEEVKTPTKQCLHVMEKSTLKLSTGEDYVSIITQSFGFNQDELKKEQASLNTLNADQTFQQNEQRWNSYLAALFESDSPYLNENKYRKVITKAMMTLITNWRSPAGDILHDGCYPSYCGFFGIWSWDSWKHASATALFHPELAKNEVRCLFDYQAENGMIPDYVSRFKNRINWRDAKPPLAAWAVKNIYKETTDKAFLAEMFDKLCRFHRWWYTDRDHNHNGVCEYGSTDGTLIAAAWESGMDNGVRFDHTKMLKNGEHAWSMDQENICLNSFLYAEKKILAEMATILDKPEVAQQFTQEAEALKTFVQTKMFDPETDFFYDTHIDTGEHIKVMGAECWLPLWAGIATPEQARQVMEKMMDPNKFNSTLPLGTLDVSHPRLRPTRGYWRGPVWVDQVYFGIQGLRNYGFDREADQLLEKFIDNAQGLTTDGPIHENYNPLTGETLNCPNFGWSSACIIKMLLNN